MTTWRRISLILVAGWLACFGAADDVSAGSETLFSAINKAGRQRMLTQRIVLKYCEEGLGIMPQESRRKRMEAIELFDQQLTYLKSVAPGPTITDALGQVERLWIPFRHVAAEAPTRKGAKRLLFVNDDLLHATHKVVLLLQDASGQSQARLVNIAGRQRMLSQRAAKFYMLQEWGFKTITIQDELERATNEFVESLTVLRGAPENTEEIVQNLSEVELQWLWFKNTLNLRGEHDYRLIVVDASEEILRQLDGITQNYERISR